MEPTNEDSYNQLGTNFKTVEFISNSSDGGMEEVQVTIEEPWGPELESTLSNWKVQAKKDSVKHDEAGYRLKLKYRRLSFVGLIVACILLIINSLGNCKESIYWQIAIVCFNSLQILVVGVNASLNLGYTYRTHFEYAAKFSELEMDIEHVLCRGEDFRPAADAFMTEIKERRKKLLECPEIPFDMYKRGK